MAQRSPAVKKKKRNRAAQEATLINLRSLQRKVAQDHRFIRELFKRVTDLEERLDAQPTGNESVFPLE